MRRTAEEIATVTQRLEVTHSRGRFFACSPRPAVRRAVRAVLPAQSRPDECSLGVDSDGRLLISSSTAALLLVIRLHPTHSRKDAAYVSLFARRPCTRVMLSELVRDNTCF